jgi:hypothetical protein
MSNKSEPTGLPIVQAKAAGIDIGSRFPKYRTKVVKLAGTGVDAAQYSIALSADSQTHTERYSWLSSHAF